MNLDDLGRKLGVEIEPKLLELALTHRSYAYEHGGIPNNERLEFLGDSVLGFVVTAHIHDNYPDLDEGDLTKIKNSVVSAKALAAVAEPLGIGEFMLLGKGEQQTGGRSKANLLADTFEALLGAAYVSKGIEAASGIVERIVFPLLSDHDALLENSEPKTKLQELAQQLNRGEVSYDTRFEGPDHERQFFTSVFFGNDLIAEGSGRSRKTSETAAAVVALHSLTQQGTHG
jgi:ribonuclease-3